eukprot:CFRG1343T1
MRGGTSKGLFFHKDHLPAEDALRDKIIYQAMGSPDKYGRQLNGMGGGISSLSKIMVVCKPSTLAHPSTTQTTNIHAHTKITNIDLDYSFGQVSVTKPVVEWNGNCGNLTTCVGPFAVDEGLLSQDEVKKKILATGIDVETLTDKMCTVNGATNSIDLHNHGTPVLITLTLRNTNTERLINSSFYVALHTNGLWKSASYGSNNGTDILHAVNGGTSTATRTPKSTQVHTYGNIVHPATITIAGVSQSHLPVNLAFLSPAGAVTGRLLPTGKLFDVMNIPGIGDIVCSMVDATTPCVFVHAQALGLTATELPFELEANSDIMSVFEEIRVRAGKLMGVCGIPVDGITPKPVSRSIPKIAIVGPSRRALTLVDGVNLCEKDMDLNIRMISMEQPHRAVPLTGGMCAAVAAILWGKSSQPLMEDVSVRSGDSPTRTSVRLGTASGVVEIFVRLTGDETSCEAFSNSFIDAVEMSSLNPLCISNLTRHDANKSNIQPVFRHHNTPLPKMG